MEHAIFIIQQFIAEATLTAVIAFQKEHRYVQVKAEQMASKANSLAKQLSLKANQASVCWVSKTMPGIERRNDRPH